MGNKSDKYTRRRLRSSYASVIISISLVLFVLGIFGLLLLNAESISRNVRENFALTLLLDENASDATVRQFQKSLELSEHVKNTEFISKEEAAMELQEELDETFLDFLGYNPLMDAIDIRLKAEYVNPDQLDALEKKYAEHKIVKEVVYDKPLIQLMNDNIERISLVLVGGCILLTLIAIGLINSSIRLSIYSRRFLIKTMQLVGANKAFIRRPFIWRSFRHGLTGAVIACGIISFLIYYIGKQVPDFKDLQNFQMIGMLFGAIVIMGLFISMTCTFFALKKYLKLKTDQLYF